MSELLRFQHGQDQIREDRHAHEQANDGIEYHGITSLHQPVARCDVPDADDEEQDGEADEQHIQHGTPR